MFSASSPGLSLFWELWKETHIYSSLPYFPLCICQLCCCNKQHQYVNSLNIFLLLFLLLLQVGGFKVPAKLCSLHLLIPASKLKDGSLFETHCSHDRGRRTKESLAETQSAPQSICLDMTYIMSTHVH